MNASYDVIIVGARIAGATLAWELSRLGLRTLLLDRAEFPSDTLSTHNVYANTLSKFREMGVLDELLATGTPLYDRAHINFEGAIIDGRFPAVDGIDGCLCVKRKYIDDILFRHARAQPGVTAMSGFRATALIRGLGGEVTGVTGVTKEGQVLSFSAPLVVGADGRRSSVRQWTGAVRRLVVPTDYASYVAYVDGYVQGEERFVEFYKQGDKLAIAFPTSDAQYVLGFMFPLSDTERIERLRTEPEQGLRALAEEGFSATDFPDRLRSASFAGRIRALLGYDNDWHAGMGRGWSLIGDAFSFKDPAVGQGIHDAVFGAGLLASTLSAYRPAEWLQAWEEMAARYEDGMQAKLRSRFEIGCQMTRNAPIPPELLGAYRLIGTDERATRTFLGMYNYTNEPSDIDREMGRLFAELQVPRA
ncbi:NAD(P)/FAD-dependent oxidoreductase [Cohnella hashimotonis]|uniref:NAD(P)/FAD-dependent oxidoreductase n=1 Tax=Cohnella hashimotonis TaxID=2826895 RepID=A0ABT6TH02_9BACL|nr:NAD(P)/FAD-dependent oxidoreductase [Cohnella hashimotonis]MDI4646114.1 NAD(P)/FAD-dependent oxidoreductase [Cohnella hashimotonis]